MNKKFIIVINMLIVVTFYGINKSNYEVIDDVNKHIVSLAKKHRFLFMGEHDSHGNRKQSEFVLKSLAGLVNEANVRFLILELPMNYQNDIDKFMETGDEDYLYKLFCFPANGPKSNNYANIDLFKYIYSFNVQSERRISIICADQSLSELLLGEKIPYYEQSETHFDKDRINQMLINRDYEAYEKIVDLATENPNANFLLFWGSFHAMKKTYFVDKMWYFDNDYKTVRKFKSLGELLTEKYKEESYTVLFRSIYISEITNLEKKYNIEIDYNDFIDGLQNKEKKLKSLAFYNPYPVRNFTDEIVYYNSPIVYGYPLTKIYCRKSIYYLIQWMKNLKEDVIPDNSLEYNLLIALIDLIRQDVYFKTYEEYYEYFYKWYEENKDTIVDLTDEEIRNSEYIFNLKICLIDYVKEYYLFRKKLIYNFVNPDDIIKRIIYATIGSEQITEKIVISHIKAEVERLKYFKNLTFPLFEFGYYEYLYNYVKQHNYDVPEFTALYEKIESNY